MFHEIFHDLYLNHKNTFSDVVRRFWGGNELEVLTIIPISSFFFLVYYDKKNNLIAIELKMQIEREKTGGLSSIFATI